jgi:hypothetical protein
MHLRSGSSSPANEPEAQMRKHTSISIFGAMGTFGGGGGGARTFQRTTSASINASPQVIHFDVMLCARAPFSQDKRIDGFGSGFERTEMKRAVSGK